MRSASLKYRCDEKLRIYSGSPVDLGFYKRNLNKARYLYQCRSTPKKKKIKSTLIDYIRKKKDNFNFKQMMDSYLNDYERLKKKFKFIQQEKTITYEDQQNKKKAMRNLFDSFSYLDKDDFAQIENIINNMEEIYCPSVLKTDNTKEDYNNRLYWKEKENKFNEDGIKDDEEFNENKEEENKEEDNKLEDKKEEENKEEENKEEDKKEEENKDEDKKEEENNEEENNEEKNKEEEKKEEDNKKEDNNKIEDNKEEEKKENENKEIKNQSIKAEEAKEEKNEKEEEKLKTKPQECPLFVKIISSEYEGNYEPPDFFMNKIKEKEKEIINTVEKKNTDDEIEYYENEFDQQLNDIENNNKNNTNENNNEKKMSEELEKNENNEKDIKDKNKEDETSRLEEIIKSEAKRDEDEDEVNQQTMKKDEIKINAEELKEKIESKEKSVEKEKKKEEIKDSLSDGEDLYYGGFD